MIFFPSRNIMQLRISEASEKSLIDKIFYTPVDNKTKIRKAPTATSAV